MVRGEYLDAFDDADAEFRVFDALAHGVFAAHGSRTPGRQPAVHRLPHPDAAHAVGRRPRSLHEGRIGRSGALGLRGPRETPRRARLPVGRTAETAAAASSVAAAAAETAPSLLFLLEAVVETPAQFVEGRRRFGVVVPAARTHLRKIGLGLDIFRVDLAQKAART